MHRGDVPGRNEDHAGFGGGDAGQFADAHVGAINFRHDVLHQDGRGPAGADAGELMLHHLLGFDHLLFRFQNCVVESHRVVGVGG